MEKNILHLTFCLRNTPLALLLLTLLAPACTPTSRSAAPPSGAAPSNNTPTGTPSTASNLISGTVTRGIPFKNSGRGTLCVAIGNSCLADNTYQHFQGLESVSIENVNLTTDGAKVNFALTPKNGKMQTGAKYYIIATLQDGGGECWMVWKRNNLFTWQTVENPDPCPSFTYQPSMPISGLNVTLTGLIPFDYTVDKATLGKTP